MWFKRLNWIKVALFNFLIVSFYGMLMRYKIGFEFPFFNQKNLQHAHSHFAFSGWVALLLMVLMVRVIEKNLNEKAIRQYHLLFAAFLVVALGNLFSFSAQGYGPVSISFSVLSILLSFLFAGMYFTSVLKNKIDFTAKKWFFAALVFSVLSSLGTFYLSYMMATKNVEQNAYLASIYWYLHFQYSGWFFFAIAGLFVDYLKKKGALPGSINRIFWMLALTCIPAYGLSILWWDLPMGLFVIVCAAAIIQFFAVLKFLLDFNTSKRLGDFQWNGLIKFLLLFVGFALCLKFLLQLGSTVPAIAKFAFGFRPIVIAYLHLVLLAFTSLFLVMYVYMNDFLQFGNNAVIGIWLLAVGILLNEVILALQGVFSLNYTLVPFANEILFGISVLIFISLIMVNRAKGK